MTNVRFEIVDAHGEPFDIQHFLEGALIEPLKFRGVRRIGDELVISIEYMHGWPRRCGYVHRYSTGLTLACEGILDGSGICEKQDLHCD